jgi:hypothetical protein
VDTQGRQEHVVDHRFTTGKKYWDGLATFQNDYFDVIDVVGERDRSPQHAGA